MKKYSIFHIEGGLGKHIAATAVAMCIKNNHPKRELIIVCAYPEIFLNLSFVDRVYRIGMTPYFYKDFIQDKDSLIFKHEPYFTTDHIHKRLHLIENWCKLYDLEYRGESPDLSFNSRQIQFGERKWKRQKPVLVLHTNGGPINDQPYTYSWARDIPFHISAEIVKALSPKYHIIQVCRSKEQAIPGTEVVSESMSNMELLSLLLFSERRILIDSCLQHASAALGLKSKVLWVSTSPEIFGYSLHENIKAEIPEGVKLPDSYLFDYNFHGLNHECPIKDLNIFDASSIINSILFEG
jgi:hypothetical protein